MQNAEEIWRCWNGPIAVRDRIGNLNSNASAYTGNVRHLERLCLRVDQCCLHCRKDTRLHEIFMDIIANPEESHHAVNYAIALVSHRKRGIVTRSKTSLGPTD